MIYIFYMVLHVDLIDLFNTVSQYLTLEWFKVVFWYQAYNAGNIPCPFPLWSGECNCDFIEVIGRWNFLNGSVCLETILGHLEIKVYIRHDPQCNASRSHFLVIPYLPKIWSKPIRIQVDHLIIHAPSPRSCYASSVWSQLFVNF